jgi:hypothetical protein
MTISSLTPSTVTTTGNNSMIGIAVLNKSLDSFELSGEGIIRMMEQSVNPMVGQNIDLKI